MFGAHHWAKCSSVSKFSLYPVVLCLAQASLMTFFNDPELYLGHKMPNHEHRLG